MGSHYPQLTVMFLLKLLSPSLRLWDNYMQMVGRSQGIFIGLNNLSNL